MNSFLVVLSFIVLYTSTTHCRPQTVQVVPRSTIQSTFYGSSAGLSLFPQFQHQRQYPQYPNFAQQFQPPPNFFMVPGHNQFGFKNLYQYYPSYFSPEFQPRNPPREFQQPNVPPTEFQKPKNPDTEFVPIIPTKVPKHKTKPKATSPKPKAPIKLVDGRSGVEKIPNELKLDVKLITAIQTSNSEYEIEEIVLVPGKSIEHLSTVQSIPKKTSLKLVQQKTPTKKQNLVGFERAKLINEAQNDINRFADAAKPPVRVDAKGITSADTPVPSFNFDVFSPHTTFIQEGKNQETTLILEPQATATSGNGGTSISGPISRAILQKGSSVKVLFHPQSVAITGANGVAHAHSDLILDFVE